MAGPPNQKTLVRLAATALLGIVTLGSALPFAVGSGCEDPREHSAATEIFQGITYGCEQLARSEEGSGRFHWVRVDLASPGVELYVTPEDPTAISQGWQYRLRSVGAILEQEDLAVAINASLFTWESNWRPPLPGDLAKGVETVVADHVVSHIWEHTYLLWFDDQLTPHLQASKPPTGAELAQAKWAVGGQGVGLRQGKVWSGSDRSPDARTAVAIDGPHKHLFLAVASHISPRRMLQKLADLGATDGMLLDGGSSSSMVIGEGSKGIFCRSLVRRLAACGHAFRCQSPAS
jgi:hypothetical protein